MQPTYTRTTRRLHNKRILAQLGSSQFCLENVTPSMLFIFKHRKKLLKLDHAVTGIKINFEQDKY
jgi:hypothetical protein